MEPKFLDEVLPEVVGRIWRKQFGTEPPFTTNPTTEAVPTGAASSIPGGNQ